MTAAISAALGTKVREFAEQDTDQVLLTRIAGGDRYAMEQFYRRHCARVYRFALARIDDPLEADDITNDVMMKAWKGAEHFRGGSPIVTWLLGIAHHRTMDSLRKRYQRAAEPLDESLVDDSAIDMASVLEAAQDARRVRAAMERLDEHHRVVMHLAFFEDLPYDAIAGILRCPEGTVKSRVFHAKQLLKRYLSER